MSDRFDELIRASAADMPDPGEYRRLNRAALRKPVPRKTKRRHSFIMVAVCLAIMVLFSGQVNQLGSDGFEATVGIEKNFRGQDIPVYKDKFDGSTLMSNMPEKDVREYRQAYAANDGIPSKLTGVEYGGKAQWIFYRKFMIDGELQEKPAENPTWLPQDTLHDYVDFMRTYSQDIKTRIAYLPPNELFILEIHGVYFRVNTWMHTYPGYGEVIFSRGFPVE